jgi:23S rRNA pseudouridine1911/1915/1917 synthase
MRIVASAQRSLLEELEESFADSSRTTLRQMLQHGRVRVNGEIEKNAKRLLHSGDLLDVSGRGTQELLDPSLTLLHEDDDLIVIVKPAGLLTVASPGEKEETAQAYLNEYLQARRQRNRIQVVHRLDRDTSGVLVFPKTFYAKEKLKEQFADHDVHRLYIAVVEGTLSPPAGTFRSNLVEGKDLRMRSVNAASGGVLAVTHYKTIRTSAAYSLLEVRLETGKRNQIRVHLAESGHPVIGDTMYGTGSDPIGRLGLHARELGFRHPKDDRPLRFEAPLPDSFRKLFG